MQTMKFEMNKVYRFKERLGKQVYVMRTPESEKLGKVLHWFGWPTETGEIEEESETEREMIRIETIQHMLKHKIITPIK